MLTLKEKEEIIEKFKLHEQDTGSAEVQIALLSEEIKKLTSHLKSHPKDFHSRRGLLKMVARRKKLLNFLEKTDKKSRNSMVRKLKLKA